MCDSFYGRSFVSAKILLKHNKVQTGAKDVCLPDQIHTDKQDDFEFSWDINEKSQITNIHAMRSKYVRMYERTGPILSEPNVYIYNAILAPRKWNWMRENQMNKR